MAGLLNFENLVNLFWFIFIKVVPIGYQKVQKNKRNTREKLR